MAHHPEVAATLAKETDSPGEFQEPKKPWTKPALVKMQGGTADYQRLEAVIQRMREA